MPEIIIKLGDNVVQKHLIYKDQVSIGRSPENGITIENLAISRKHATITCDGDRYFVEDNESSNGTFINGVRVTRTEIVDKDVITIGKHRLYFYHTQLAAGTGGAHLAEKTMLVSPEPLDPPTLRVVRGKQLGEIFTLGRTETRVGRSPDNDIHLSDWFVSKHHLVVIRRGTSYWIRDLGSWRHTLVNGVVAQEQALQAGDEIQLGPKTTLLFEAKDAVLLDPVLKRLHAEMNGDPASVLVEGWDSERRAALRHAEPEAVHSAVDPSPRVEQDSDAEARDAGWAGLEFPAADGASPQQHTELAADAAMGGPQGDNGESWKEAAPDAAPPETAQEAASESEAQDAPEAESVAQEGGEAIMASVSAAVSEAARAQTEEVALWLRALENPSPLIRRQAQRRLKVLTGRDYDLE